jgi:hypothetical protein
MLRFFVRKAVGKTKRLKSRVKNAHKAKRVDALARRMQSVVSADLVDGINTFKKRISREALMDAWERGDYDGLGKHIPWDELHGDLKKFSSGMGKALWAASLAGIQHLPPPAKEMRWDMGNPKMRGFVDKRVGNLVEGITSDAKANLRTMVSRAFTERLTPKQVADEIKGSIGLHDRYTNALRNYKEGLIQQGKEPDVVDRMAGKYEERLLDARALTVARTEIRQATNYGQRAVWKEAADQGFIDKNKARRIYVVDGAPCEICEPMDGQETTLDEPFHTADGEPVEPGEVHPNCECIEILELGD